MVLITASRILRKFLFLSEAEQSKLIDVTISKLEALRNEKVVTTYAKSLFQNVNATKGSILYSKWKNYIIRNK